MNTLFGDMQELICETVERLVDIADNHNYDRDDVIRKFAVIFDTLSEVAILREYERESEVEE